jgi:hypothetical protein
LERMEQGVMPPHQPVPEPQSDLQADIHHDRPISPSSEPPARLPLGLVVEEPAPAEDADWAIVQPEAVSPTAAQKRKQL